MRPNPLLLSSVLASYVAWAAAQPAAQPAAQAPAADHGWHQSQARDAADTYTFTRFTLVGRFLGSSAQPADRPALSVDCIPRTDSTHARFLGADLLVGTTLKIDYVEPAEIRGTNYYPKVAVEYRLDAREAEQQQWPAGTDRIPTARPSDKLSASVPRGTLRQMLHAHTVVITASDEHGAPIEMQFDIPDPTPVEAACHVD